MRLALLLALLPLALQQECPPPSPPGGSALLDMTIPPGALFGVEDVQPAKFKEDATGTVKVRTCDGEVLGLNTTTRRYHKPMQAFLGVPYATARRFQCPAPVEPWEGVIDTTEDGKACYGAIKGFGEFSEDCLHCWVYTPSVTRKKLPVMVWIYGGGFLSGSCSSSSYSLENFVERDIVGVCCNYRLGPFGFLFTGCGKSDIQGNMGLLDQAMALKWVQKNIAYFGGDPKKVTLAGQSAGSASISIQMLSEQSKGLFRNVIMESGVGNCPWAIIHKDEAQRRGLQFAESLGCVTSDGEISMECLQNAPAEQVNQGNNVPLRLRQLFEFELFYFVVVYGCVCTSQACHGESDCNCEAEDDEPQPYICHHPLELLKNKEVYFKGRALIGNNADEGRFLVPAFLSPLGPVVVAGINADPTILVSSLLKRTGCSCPDVAEEVSSYYTNCKPFTVGNPYQPTQAITDNAFIIPIQEYTQYLSKVSGVKVHRYIWSFDLGCNLHQGDPSTKNVPGCHHSDEISVICPRKKNSTGYDYFSSPADKDTPSGRFIDLLVDFLSSMIIEGKPTIPGKPRLKPYKPCHPYYVNIRDSDNITLARNPYAAMVAFAERIAQICGFDYAHQPKCACPYSPANGGY